VEELGPHSLVERLEGERVIRHTARGHGTRHRAAEIDAVGRVGDTAQSSWNPRLDSQGSQKV
jgi:hypothetical protein